MHRLTFAAAASLALLAADAASAQSKGGQVRYRPRYQKTEPAYGYDAFGGMFSGGPGPAYGRDNNYGFPRPLPYGGDVPYGGLGRPEPPRTRTAPDPSSAAGLTTFRGRDGNVTGTMRRGSDGVNRYYQGGRYVGSTRGEIWRP